MLFNEHILTKLTEHAVGSSPRLALAVVLAAPERLATFRQVAAQMGVSEDRAAKAIAVLKKAGLVEVQYFHASPSLVKPHESILD